MVTRGIQCIEASTVNDVSMTTARSDGPSGEAGTLRHFAQGRLFRKYLLLILSLVSFALLVSGAVGMYFSYRDTRAALADLQHEKALAAASRIEQYMRQIEQQLA